jgi:nitrogenase molybdenum-iron protein beta chain
MLDLTPRDGVAQRHALVINPAKTCQPVGAVYAALGVHRCMPHSHGSQGCAAFHRMYLTRHFKEPAMASTSAFTEGTSVFGGGANLKTAMQNVFDLYDPDVMAIHTTCLSETIGDDLHAYLSDTEIPEGKHVIYCSTPSYVGSHIWGFAAMTEGFVKQAAQKSGVPTGRLALFPGFVNPGDMREYKRLMEQFGIEYTMLPDTSGVLDAPMTGTFELYPKGGTRFEDIVKLGDAAHSIALGEAASERPASQLQRDHRVSSEVMGLPIGVTKTDAFISALSRFSGEPVPYAIEEERGQVVDIMLDAQQYFKDRRVAIYGDPDTVLGIASLCLELGMIPSMMVTGTPMPTFQAQAKALLDEYGLVEQCWAQDKADLFELHQRIIQAPVDLLVGGTHGKQIARAEDIPFVRAGFPIMDRYVHSYMPLVGYRGAMRLIELMSNALMDRQDRDCSDEDFEMVM